MNFCPVCDVAHASAIDVIRCIDEAEAIDAEVNAARAEEFGPTSYAR